MLRINDPGEYRLDKGDVLGIVADEVVNKMEQPIPVQFVQNPNSNKTAVLGLPVPVQDDGNIILPLLDPIDVRGKTLPQVRQLIIEQMRAKELVPKEGKKAGLPFEPRVLVDLIQARRYRVLVVREDTQPLLPQFAAAGNTAAVVGGNKRGAAFSLLLEPGHNDLLQALTQTGGPPGLEAKNEVVIRRGKYDPADPSKGYIRIPLRVAAGPADHLHRGRHHAPRRRYRLHRGPRHRGLLHRRPARLGADPIAA